MGNSKIALSLVLGTTFALGAFVLSACNMYQNFYEDVEDATLYRRKTLVLAPVPADGKLTIMNWNIKFGGARIDFFFDCFGDRAVMSHSEVESNLAGLLSKINQVNPDIVLLQEVDVDSKRSDYIDMAQYILDRTQLNYGAYATQWLAERVPQKGLGRMDNGNLILSRWPIDEAYRLKLAKSEEEKPYRAQFLIKRNVLATQVHIPGYEPLHVLDVHTDAYSKDGTKKKHIDEFKHVLDGLNGMGAKFVAGGDLNALPPGTKHLKQFDDSVCKDTFIADDYSGETEWLVPLFDTYKSYIDLESYAADETRWYSHSVDGRGFWNRTLDYLFTNADFTPGSGLVHQNTAQGGMETMPLSDHAPVTAVLELGEATVPVPAVEAK